MQILKDIDYMEFLGHQESQYLIRASEIEADLLARLAGNDEILGDVLPWYKTQNKVSLRKGEVSIWAGVNGHGKSQLLGMVCAWGIKVNRWLIASLEMKPVTTMHRMVRQVSGTRNPSNQYVSQFLKRSDERLWLYDQTDTVKPERILAMCHYAAKKLNINHVIIDSLMKCGIKNDDYNMQKEFVDRLCWCAKSNDIHIHLVHHIRKGDKESNIPDKFDIRGAGEITDLVDNVFIVHRNKKKEADLNTGKTVDPEDPDCTLAVAKQRNGEWEGVFKFWFHVDSQQYTPNSDNRVIPYEH